MDPKLIALYELKRQTFLLGYIQNPDRFSDALAFAYYNRVAPIFHENIQREIYERDPFKEIYSVKATFVDEVARFIDESARKGDLTSIEFYNLEDRFGGYKAYRMELIHALEYMRIDRRFDDVVWQAIQRNAPMEANGLASTFSPNEVEFN